MAFIKGKPMKRPEFPKKAIVRDIRHLYPEAWKIEVAGSWARDEMHDRSDIDVLIRFPKGTDGFAMLVRDCWMENGKEMTLNRRWSSLVRTCVDFIIRVDGTSGPGQHLWRIENDLPTPTVPLWRKEKESDLKRRA